MVDDAFLKSPRFRIHANALMRTFSGTGKNLHNVHILNCGAGSFTHPSSLLLIVDMLGPNLEVMQETLVGLGRQHRRYGVNRKHFEFMGIALLGTVQELLGETFTAEQKLSWEECWKIMINSMLQGLEE